MSEHGKLLFRQVAKQLPAPKNAASVHPAPPPPTTVEAHPAIEAKAEANIKIIPATEETPDDDLLGLKGVGQSTHQKLASAGIRSVKALLGYTAGELSEKAGLPFGKCMTIIQAAKNA